MNQLNEMENWLIVTSSDGYDSDGIPFGQVLCRSKIDAKDLINERLIGKDVLIKCYNKGD